MSEAARKNHYLGPLRHDNRPQRVIFEGLINSAASRASFGTRSVRHDSVWPVLQWRHQNHCKTLCHTKFWDPELKNQAGSKTSMHSWECNPRLSQLIASMHPKQVCSAHQDLATFKSQYVNCLPFLVHLHERCGHSDSPCVRKAKCYITGSSSRLQKTQAVWRQMRCFKNKTPVSTENVVIPIFLGRIFFWICWYR